MKRQLRPTLAPGMIPRRTWVRTVLGWRPRSDATARNESNTGSSPGRGEAGGSGMSERQSLSAVARVGKLLLGRTIQPVRRRQQRDALPASGCPEFVDIFRTRLRSIRSPFCANSWDSSTSGDSRELPSNNRRSVARAPPMIVRWGPPNPCFPLLEHRRSRLQGNRDRWPEALQ
jgi:hypothetical protein